MKHLLTPRLGLALALGGAILPLSIAGCGGGNSFLQQTSPFSSTTFTLANGQRSSLSGLRKADGSATGKLKITNALSQGLTLSTGALNADAATVFVPGDYDFSGIAGPDGRFDVTGTILIQGNSTPVPFRLQGTLTGANGGPGTYAFTVNGETENGSIPVSAGGTTAGGTTAGGTTAGGTTAGGTTSGGTTSGGTTSGGTTSGGTTSGGTTSGTTPRSISGNLRFSNILPADSVVSTAITSFAPSSFTDATYNQSSADPTRRYLNVVFAARNSTPSRSFAVSLSGPSVISGSSFVVKPEQKTNLSFQQAITDSNTGFPTYFAQSGTIRVISAGATIQLEYQNVLFQAKARDGRESSFILNGPLTVTGAQVIP